MGRTYRKTEEDYESKRSKQDKQRERSDRKRDFLKNEPRKSPEDDASRRSYGRNND